MQKTPKAVFQIKKNIYVMNIITITARHSNDEYRMHKIFGVLLKYENLKNIKETILPNKIIKHIEQVENPYKLSHYSDITPQKNIRKGSFTKILAKTYTYLCLKSFLFVRILSNLRFPIFDTTEESILYYHKIFPGNQQNLCLPRVLFAAATSKSFKDYGAVFIGVFLPSSAMHAWIIENEKQPDFFDHNWIYYQPVAVMYNK